MLNSPIYKHFILNAKSTLNPTVFQISRTGCVKKEHGFCLHVHLASNPSSNTRSRVTLIKSLTWKSLSCLVCKMELTMTTY